MKRIIMSIILSLSIFACTNIQTKTYHSKRTYAHSHMKMKYLDDNKVELTVSTVNQKNKEDVLDKGSLKISSNGDVMVDGIEYYETTLEDFENFGHEEQQTGHEGHSH